MFYKIRNIKFRKSQNFILNNTLMNKVFLIQLHFYIITTIHNYIDFKKFIKVYQIKLIKFQTDFRIFTIQDDKKQNI